MPAATPFQSLSARTRTQHADRRALLALRRGIEERAARTGPGCVLWATYPDLGDLTGPELHGHRRLAAAGVRVHLFAAGMGTLPPEPALGLHDLDPSSALAREWSTLLVAPGFAVGLSAREVAGPVGGGDLDRRFAWLLTEDRSEVVYATAALPADRWAA